MIVTKTLNLKLLAVNCFLEVTQNHTISKQPVKLFNSP